jgi:tRNA threonylcarbamoyladenosine biosynthesis protein TsaB
MLIHIDTATPTCSAAISQSGKLIDQILALPPANHSNVVHQFIAQLMERNNVDWSDIQGISVGIGPGSYTGLRIGLSAAKGLCFARNLPLFAINTLEAMAVGMMMEMENRNCLYCPMLDARRLEVYTLIINDEMEYIWHSRPYILTTNEMMVLLEKQKIVFAGNGLAKAKPYLENDNAIFIDHFESKAEFQTKLAHQLFIKNHSDPIAYLEPLYLKNFGEH